MKAIKLFGRTYLFGRRLNFEGLVFLVVRDILLRPFLTAPVTAPPDMREVRQICVAKPDYLGDVLMTVPALQLLRTMAPQARIILVAGEWTQILVEFLRANGIVDEVIIFSPALLDRSPKSLFKKLLHEFKTLGPMIRLLKQKKIDLFFDLRAFSPNSWGLGVFSHARYRAGFGLRGMSFTYHHLIPFDNQKSMGQLFLDAVCGPLNERVEYRRPYLPSARSQAQKVLPEKMDRPYLVLQLYSGEVQRNVPLDCWYKIMECVRNDYSLVLVGSEADGKKAAEDNLQLSGLYSLMGKTTILELLRVVEESEGVISVDSFSAHVGLAYGKRVAVLAMEGFSDRHSYPQGNPNLAYFSCPPVSYAEIGAFLQSSATVAKSPAR